MANRALLIGINEYEHVGSLAGCLNDVELLGGVLTGHYGFEDSDITRVVDPDNSRADILDAFDSFVADSYAAVLGDHPDGLPDFSAGARSARVVDAVLRSAADDSAWTTVDNS